MRHIPEGGDFFDGQNKQMHGDFGFSGSIKQREVGGHPPFGGNKPTHDMASAEKPGDYATGGKIRNGAVPYAGDAPTHGMKHTIEPMEQGGGDYAHGGTIHPHGNEIVHEEPFASGGRICHMSHGGYSVHHPDGRVTHHTARHREIEGASMGGEYAGNGMHLHPHGHAVTKVEQELNGAVIHHHAHGGYTMHHADGRVTHHMADDTPAHMARGGIEHMHDPETEYVHRAKRARGGDMEQDRAMIKKAFRQHENAEHHGEHETLSLRRGGMARMPHGMAAKPMGGAGAGAEMPMNQPPRFGRKTTTPRNIMPGGEMAYGVEPGSEPDEAGTEQGITPLRRGGRAGR